MGLLIPASTAEQMILAMLGARLHLGSVPDSIRRWDRFPPLQGEAPRDTLPYPTLSLPSVSYGYNVGNEFLVPKQPILQKNRADTPTGAVSQINP